MLSPEAYRKHYFTTVQQDMRDIASPLRQYGITHFARSCVHADKNVEILTSDVKVSTIFFDMKCYEHLFNGNVRQYVDGALLWSDLTDDNETILDFLNAIESNVKISNGITIVKKHKESVEFYYFGSDKKVGMNSFYFNNMDLLISFIAYFNDVGGPLLKRTFEERIFAPSSDDKSALVSRDFQKQLSVQWGGLREYFDHLSDFYQLTAREKACAIYLAQGKRAKDIAERLALSARTVEKYINNLRYKTNSDTLCSAVVKLFGGNSLIN